MQCPVLRIGHLSFSDSALLEPLADLEPGEASDQHFEDLLRVSCRAAAKVQVRFGQKAPGPFDIARTHFPGLLHGLFDRIGTAFYA